jgi:hypothetical protein
MNGREGRVSGSGKSCKGETRMTTVTMAKEEVTTDFQTKMLIEMIKDIVRELRDPDKIIERLDQIERGEAENPQKLSEETLERKAEEEERRYQNMTLEEIKTEIAALEVKYGTTPNAETAAAIEELRTGKGERVTIDQIMAELHAER